MKLDEAIEILEQPFPRPVTRRKGTYTEAIKLGIEALKRVRDCRKVIDIPLTNLLPGETRK